MGEKWEQRSSFLEKPIFCPLGLGPWKVVWSYLDCNGARACQRVGSKHLQPRGRSQSSNGEMDVEASP
eukprot:3668014-Amphidinium_carterae.1